MEDEKSGPVKVGAVILCADVMDALESGLDEYSPFDASFQDPPYGIGMMSKFWDRNVPGVAVWEALIKHLRPGANLLAFGGTRTYHRMTCYIEDAGFEIRDSIATWLYGAGFPKPGNVSKYIDKRLGNERPVIGQSRPRIGKEGAALRAAVFTGVKTAAGSDEAARFEGYHSNLKPAWEPVIVARKPLVGGLAGNALDHGVAGFNVDACRVDGGSRRAVIDHPNKVHNNHASGGGKYSGTTKGAGMTGLGRWPANVILTCDESICGPGNPREIEHQPGCHVFEIDRQSGTRKSGPAKYALAGIGKSTEHCVTNATGKKARGSMSGHDDEGGASRFFYVAKVSSSERGRHTASPLTHPTMKPIELCEYLARLILPPERADKQPRTLITLFSGTGSEVIGALRAGWERVIGVEMDPEYAAASRERIEGFKSEFKRELDLADVLRERGHITARDFKAHSIKTTDWKRRGFVAYEASERRYIPGKNPLPGAGFSVMARSIYV